MRILIAGAGSIGSVLGVVLSNTQEVVFLRRSPPFGKIQISVVGELEYQTGIRVVNLQELEQENSFDLIFFTIQHQQTKMLCDQLKDTLAADVHTLMVSLQNGMDGATIIQQYFPDNPVLTGAVWWSAALIDQQKILYHRKAPTVIGIPKGSIASAEQLELVESVLADLGNISSTDDILTEMRKKLILNVVSPVLALVKQPYPQGLQNNQVRSMVHALYDEAVETAEILGWNIDDTTDRRLHGFHSLLISGDIPEVQQSTPHTHKVSTQLGMEKYGGSQSNVHALLDWLLLSGSRLADEMIQLVESRDQGYDPIDPSILTIILQENNHARCMWETDLT